MTPEKNQKHYAISQHALCCKYLDVAEPYDGDGDTLLEAVVALMKDRDEWVIEFHALKNAVAETLEENRHLADGDQCTLKKLKDAYAKAKNAGQDLDSENADVEPPR